MLDGVRPYAKYKDSDELRLGAIPTHWETRRIKYLLREVDSRSSKGTETLLSMRQVQGLIPHHDVSMRPTDQDKLIGYKIVGPDEIVLNRMQASNGMFARSRMEGLVSPDYAVFRPIADVNLDFLVYLFKSPQMRALFRAESRGLGTGTAGFLRLYSEDFGATRVALPSRHEQDQIVQFLDAHGRKVAAFIRNRRRLIELLSEQRQSVISRAVAPTCGASVPGVNPMSWSQTRLKFVSEVQTGITLGKNYSGADLVVRPYLRVANVQNGHLKLADVGTISVPISEVLGSTLEYGDVLMTEGGDLDKLGRGCVWRGEIENCLHQNHIFAVRPDQNHLLPEYLEMLLTSHHGRRYFELTGKQTTNLASTNSTTLMSFPFLLPSIVEQRRIIDFVGIESSTFATAISRAQREIDLAREYQTKLASDVVTGKVDVQHLAPEQVDADLEAIEALGENGDELDDVDDLNETVGVGEPDS